MYQLGQSVKIAAVLGVFIVSVVGLALTPTIGDSVATATGGNITGISATLLDLFPVFWVIMLLAIPIVAVYGYFKSMEGGNI